MENEPQMIRHRPTCPNTTCRTLQEQGLAPLEHNGCPDRQEGEGIDHCDKCDSPVTAIIHGNPEMNLCLEHFKEYCKVWNGTITMSGTASTSNESKI